MSKSKIFFYLCTSFIVGIFLSSCLPAFFEISKLANLAIAFVSIILICIFWKSPKIKIFGLCGLVLLFGIWHYQRAQTSLSQIAFLNGKDKITFQGIVVKEPDLRQDKVRLVVKVNKVSRGQRLSSAGNLGQVLVVLPRALQYHYGDKLELTGKLQTPKDTEEFSYKDYLASYAIYSICYYPEVKQISSNHGHLILRIIFSFKDRLKDTINSVLPEPQASYLSGMLLGEKRAMPQEIREWFNKCSTTHITVISGMHVSIIAGLLMNFGLAIYLSRRQAILFALAGITLFLILTGAAPSAIRASIMGGLVLLAMCSGRLSDVKNALVFAATIMLLINPQVLKFDIGFQLSFLATLGIVYLSPYLEKRLRLFPETFKIRDSASMTLSAQIFTLPIILFHFGRISLIAPIANILILPLIPLTMILGFIAGILGIIWLFLGKIIGWFAWLLLTYEILVVKWLSKIPFASVEIKNVWLGLLGIYYLVLFGWLWLMMRKEATRI